MAKKSGGMFVGTPYNQTTSGDAPDESGGGNYASYTEVMSAHLSEEGASLEESENSASGKGIMGGPAPGEPNPSKQSTVAQAK